MNTLDILLENYSLKLYFRLKYNNKILDSRFNFKKLRSFCFDLIS